MVLIVVDEEKEAEVRFFSISVWMFFSALSFGTDNDLVESELAEFVPVRNSEDPLVESLSLRKPLAKKVSAWSIHSHR